MTFKRHLQQEIELKANIEEVLKHLRDFGLDDLPLIGRRLGYKKNPFTKLNTDSNYFGSPQLLAGLLLIRELETLKKEAEDVWAAKRAIQQLMTPSAAMIMNEPGKSTPEVPGSDPVSYHVQPVHVKFGVQRGAVSEARRTPSKKGGGAKK